ncbi:MAG: hypothetical protein JWO83_4771 [Caulobacteraceae bacterium]|jgi:hypothetical protein|nr:hypothetical protein [Caulobacteraceae bacterium]
MTPDERALLQRFLQDLVQTRGVAKDPEADSMIRDALRASPDAAYVLVQHAILSDQALHAAQDQITTLQEQLRNAGAAPPARFLGGPSPWAQAAAPQPQPQPQPQWQPQPQPSRGFFGPGPFASGGGLGSFLRNAGTTAAGVAGGALLFEGLSGLFGGHGGGYGGFGGGFGGQPTEVVNNYYEDGGDNGGDFGGGDFGGDSGGGWDDSGSSDT